MPKLQPHHADEPLCKKARKSGPHMENNMQRRQSKRQAVRAQKKAQSGPLNILDLPPEILEKIIGNVNIWHHNRIRGTSKRMRDVSDVFIRHEFNKALAKNIQVNPNSYESAALRSIEQATEVYVHSGFESVFCGCILPMLRSSYRDPFCPKIHQIRMFLRHFYDMVEDLCGDPTSQQSRLLYSVTFMRFFKAFNKATVLSSSNLPLHWRTVVALERPWFGMLWRSKNRSINQPGKQSNLLVILTELLIADISGKAFKRVWECPSQLYVFGNDISSGKRNPRTLFTITVHGSKKLCSLLHYCLNGDPQQLVWPAKWPKDQFTLNLDINCKEATKWGCPQFQHVEFGPFTSPSNSINDFRCEECESSIFGSD